MFAMYDDDGLRFRSTIDNLYKINDIPNITAIKNDLKDKHTFKDDLYKGKITKEAKQKYKQVASLDTRTEIFHVEQLMNRKIFTVDDTTPIQECYNIMVNNKIQQLPILSDNTKNIKSMITLKDILYFLTNDLEYAQQNIQKKVDDILTQKAITTDPISDIRRVSKVMCDFGLNAMPVVDSEHNLVGIISRYDIVKAVSSIPHLQIWA